MKRTRFEFDADHLHAQAFAAWDTAGILLFELVKAKGGNGPWLDELKTNLLERTQNLEITEGDVSQSSLDEIKTASASVVTSIMERVTFTKDPNEITHHL